jgi:hypothetical protein
MYDVKPANNPGIKEGISERKLMRLQRVIRTRTPETCIEE